VPFCSACGTALAEDARFCAACGAPVAGASPAGPPATTAPESPVESRKVVTVVFCDLVGSTALAERLDPEVLRAVLARYWDTMRGAIERHGGLVEKFIGDAVVAVFGLPVVHEDDALRAVRAAEDMRSELDGLNAELDERWGVSIAIHVGVNTGEVVAGDMSRGSSFVTADAVNVAARFEQAAGENEILIGSHTYELVRDAVDAEPTDPLALKGKSGSIPAYRLAAVRTTAGAIARRADARFVGRDAELGAMRAALDRVERMRRCEIVTVAGVAGVGKSRLVDEFAALAAERAGVLRGSCLSYGEGITFWPLAEVVKRAAGISEGEPPEEAREKIASLLSGSESAEATAATIAGAIGLGDPVGRQPEIFLGVRRLLETLARPRPLVLVVEDIHWAQDTLLDLLEYLRDFSREAPLLIVCVTRPELLGERPDWTTAAGTSIVRLAPLGEEDAQGMLSSLLGGDVIPDEVLAWIGAATQGNPLFAQELLRSLLEDGVLVRDADGWALRGELQSVGAPATIQALLGARLERLAEADRELAQAVSVIGQVFSWSAAAALVPPLAPTLGRHLRALMRHELVEPERTAMGEEDAFRFAHILIRDAAYTSLLKNVRARLHEAFADWLEREWRGRPEEYEAIIGYHLEQAHGYRVALARPDGATGRLAARAAALLGAAGERAQARGDVSAAANLLERAVVLEPEAKGRAERMLALGDVLLEAGLLPDARARFEETLILAEELRDERLEWHARVGRADTELWEGGLTADAQAVAESARQALERLGDASGVARASSVLARCAFWSGDGSGADEAWQTAADCAGRAGDLRREADALKWLMISACLGPRPAPEGIELCQEILVAHSSNRELEAFALIEQAPLRAMRGEIEEARRLIARGREMLTEMGMTLWAAGLCQEAAVLEMVADAPERAEPDLRASCETLEALGERAFLATRIGTLAEVVYRQGRFDEAAELAARTREMATADDLDALARAAAVEARLAARGGAHERGDALAREALQLAKGVDLHMRATVYLGVADVYAAAGRQADRDAAVTAAYELFERKGDIVSAARVRRRLG
jgi:class 3 adenylate cyclase/tetratricopeptide (TPR) repeat protein